MICKKCKNDLPEESFRHVKNSCKNRHGNGKIYHFISIRTTCKECENKKNTIRVAEWKKTEKGKARQKVYFKNWYDNQKAKMGDKYVYTYFIKRGLKVKDISPELIEIKRQLNILKQNIKNHE